MVPTDEIAIHLIKRHYGAKPASVRRFTTGLHHYVYDCVLATGESIVFRATRPSEKLVMASALYWNEKLRPMGVPLPEVYFSDLEFQFPYIVLERFPGVDIGYVIRELSAEQMDTIAKQLMTMQKAVNSIKAFGKYGYAIYAEDAPHKTWTDELRSSLKQTRIRIESAGVFSTQCVDDVESWLTTCSKKLDRQPAIPFLHDITTKNVIVRDGKLTGIVDVDNLCFGDPLFQVALTQMALLSDGSPLDYIQFLLKHYGVYEEEFLQLYTAICCVHFMSELGQEFNGLNTAISESRKILLESIFSKILTRSLRTSHLRARSH